MAFLQNLCRGAVQEASQQALGIHSSVLGKCGEQAQSLGLLSTGSKGGAVLLSSISPEVPLWQLGQW